MVTSKTSKKEVKKEVKKSFYFTVLYELNSNYKQTLSSIAKKHDISKQNMTYYSRQMKELGYIIKLGYGTWGITDLGIEKLRSKKINVRDVDDVGIEEKLFNIKRKTGDLHKYTFQFPIIKGTVDFIKMGGYEPKKGLKGWKPQYLDIDKPFKILFKNNNNKSITGYVKSRRVNNIRVLKDMANLIVEFTYGYFRKHNLHINKDKAYCQDLHIEINDEVAEKNLEKGDQITVQLNKFRGKITPNDPLIKAKAWADTSPEPSIGSNDPEWWEAYLRMPLEVLKVKDLLKVLSKVSIETSIQNKSTVKILDRLVPKLPKINESDLEDLPIYIG